MAIQTNYKLQPSLHAPPACGMYQALYISLQGHVIFLLVFWCRVMLCNQGYPGTLYEAKADFELKTIFLSQSPKCQYSWMKEFF